MRTRSVILGAVTAVCLLAGCGSTRAGTTLGTTKTSTGGSGATTAKAASGGSTTAKAGSGSSTTARAATPGSGSSTTKEATAGAVGAEKLAVATTPLGQVLVDAEGRTVYLYKKDIQGKAGTCDGSCAVTWPPVETKDAPVAGTGLDGGKLTTIKRADGSEQVAYDGWPLYRHDGDKKAGDTTGEGVGSAWFAVSPAGTPIAG